MRRLLLLIALLTPLTAGCWDRHEPNELGLVVVDGYDWNPKTGYELTSEVLNARTFVISGQSSGSTSDAPESLLINGQGHQLLDAVTQIEQRSSRHIFFSSSPIIVIGEGMARHGLAPLLSMLLHRQDIRGNARRIVLVRGTAKSLLSVPRSGLEVDVGFATENLTHFQYLDVAGPYPPRVHEVLRWLREKDHSAVIPALTVRSAPQRSGDIMQITSAGVFRGDKLVAWIPTETVRTINLLSGHFTHANLTFSCPGGHPGSASTLLKFARGTSEPIIAGNRLLGIKVEITATGQLIETACPVVGLSALSSGASAALLKETATSIAWAKKAGLDVFGWGETIYRQDPQTWRTSLAGKWPEILRSIPVTLRVRVNLVDPGRGA